MPVHGGYNILKDARHAGCYKENYQFKKFYLIPYFRHIWLITEKNKNELKF